jgi:hypothetical protein
VDEFVIAFPVLHRTKGIDWQIVQNVFITRKDFADSLLTTLEQACNKDPTLTAPGMSGG